MADRRLVRLFALALTAVVAAGCGDVATRSLDPPPTTSSPTTPPVTPTISAPSSVTPTGAASVAPAVRQIAERFVRFALDESGLGAVPFADRVALGLGSTILTTVPRPDLARPATWDLVMDGYAGRSGALSPLAGIRQLVDEGGTTVVSTGVHDHCASPPLPLPDAYARDLQVVVQPSWNDIDSCLDWFSVDLFVRHDRIVAVTLSLFEP